MDSVNFTPAEPVQSATQTGATHMDWMKLLIAAISLAPYVAQGVAIVKKDCDLGDKKKAAQDSLSTLTGAALAVVPDEHKDLANAAAQAAQLTMDAVITATHEAQQTPAPAASLPAAA